MTIQKCFHVLALTVVVPLAFGGCDSSKPGASGKPSFTLAWSEYPSWSVFGVAHEKKIINGKKGETGPLEDKWGVDIVLKEVDYDTCLTLYATSACDAVCITNMDSLNPALSRESTAIMPTSTSVGADACIVVGIKDVEELKKHKVYGLEKSVSEYCFVRCLEKLNQKESDYEFVNLDPGVAAQQLQNGKINACVVWNPFVLQTLKTNKDASVLFSSELIPGEIVDMVVMAKSSLDKPGGVAFAHAVVDTFYEVNKMLLDTTTRNDTLVALGAKFSSLNAEEMEKVVQQTVFYKTPEEGLKLFKGSDLPEVMKTVVSFCTKHGIVDKEPSIGYGPASATPGQQLRFDPSFMEEVQKKRG